MVPLLVMGILMGIAACGKKGPPFLPQKEFFVKVEDLEGEPVNGHIVLKGNISGHKGPAKITDAVKGSRVYYRQYPLESPPCDGCPIKYQSYHGFGSEVITEEGFRCKVPDTIKGQIYFLEVRLMGPGKTLGPPSNRVKVVVE